MYRALCALVRPKALRRSDCGQPRVLSKQEMASYCELIAAIKVRTSNKKGRHLSTSGAIQLLENYGIETPSGFIRAPKSILKIPTVNRYLKQWGYDRNTLGRQPPAVRFQARYSNECWQFDLSPSDLKAVKQPLWIKEEKGHPTLMLYSVVDDRSGVAYQEYHCVYGEDVEAALRFLFNAMSSKDEDGFPLQGIPEMILADNGPISKSHVFQQVLQYLGVQLQTHMPRGTDGRRVTARTKGKVERPFRSVKEMHETLYHFHEPQNEVEANRWLLTFLLRYNGMQHRHEEHSRIEDWLAHLPASGIREMCSWDRFCTFAREPQQRKVSADARVAVDGIPYEVEPDLAGETVILWWGLFDNELYIEHRENRYGPYRPVGGPIPLHRYRAFKKTRTQKRAERIEVLAKELRLPSEALSDGVTVPDQPDESIDRVVTFVDPDPFQEFTFQNPLAAKRAIADELGLPLAKLRRDQLDYIDSILAETLNKQDVMNRVRQQIQRPKKGEQHAK